MKRTITINSIIVFICYIILFSANKVSAQTITIGAQTIQSGTSGISPYNYAYESRRVQFIYTKDEIESAGGFAGAISSIAWDVSQINGGELSNYEIRFAHTTATDVSAHRSEALTTVKGSHTLTPGTIGWRTIDFDNNFAWNGTDNILVDVCFGVNSGFAFNGQIWMFNDVANQTRGSASISVNQCGVTTTTARNYKPRVQLTFIIACNAPTTSMTRICAPDYQSYSVSIEVTALGDATSIDITDGTITYFSNVGLGTYTINDLTTAKTIRVQDHVNASCRNSQSFSLCDVCNSSSLPADECIDAPLIDLAQPFAGSTTCSYTASAGSPSVCGQSIENDSWIRFIAGDTEVEIEIEVGICTPFNRGIQLAVFSGTCGSLAIIPGSCAGPGSNPDNANSIFTWNFTGMTIGATYYIRIDGYAGDLCDYWFTPVSGVVITPDNDLCENAIELNCGITDVASNILATNTDAPSSCIGGSLGAGVWYKFTGTGQYITLTTDNSTTNMDTRINIYSGSCGSLSCVGGDDNSGSGLTSTFSFTTVLGTQYFIYVDGNPGSEGQWEISFDCDATLPVINSQPTNQTVCSTAENISFELVSTGADSHQWQINNAGTWSNLSDLGVYSGVTTNTLNITNVIGLIGNEYRCVLTNINGSVNSNVVTIINSQSVGGDVSGGTTICSGSDSGLLTLNNYTGDVDRWQYSVNDGVSWLNILNNLATYTSGALTQTTWFRAIVINGTCPEAASSHTVVTVDPASAVGATTVGSSPICQSTSTTVSIASSTGTIQWQQSANGINGWVNVTGGSGATTLIYSTPNLISTTYYRAVVTSGVCSSINSTVVMVEVTPATVGGFVTGGAPICSGFTSGLLSLSDHIGNVIKWQSSTNSGTTWIDIAHAGTTYTSGALLQTTWFRAVVQNGVCSEAYSSHTVVTVNALPNTSAISGNQTPACNAGGIVYSVTNTAGSSYAWSVPAGASIVAGDGTNQISVNFGSTNGNVSVVETNSASCIGTQQNRTISLQGCGLDANFSANNTNVCTGADVIFTNTSTGTTDLTTYSWNFGAGASPATTTGAGPHTVTYSTSGNKTVSLTITDGASDTETKTDYITVNPYPAASGSISGTATICATTNGVSYSVAAIANATAYVWNYSGTGVTINGSGSSVNLDFASNATSGNLSVYGTNDCGSGTTSANFPITVNPLPTATISGTATICTGQNATVTITLTGSQPWSITYLRDGANAQTVNGITTSPHTFTTTTAGNYTLSAVSDANCTGTFSGIATIAFNALPTATISGTTTVCQGSNATISVALTGAQPWNITYQRDGANDVTVNDITMSPYTFTTSTAGTYIVLDVSDANCTGNASGSAIITVDPTSVGGTAAASNSTICSGSSSSITLSGHTGTIQWQQSNNGTDSWINVVGGSGATTAIYTTPALTSTTYYRAVVTSGVCSSTNSTVAAVVVNPTSAVGVVSVTSSPICYNSNTSVSISSATGSIQWQQSANGIDCWADVTGGSGATSLVYATPMLTATTYYRSIVTSGICSQIESSVAEVVVTPATVGGVVSGGAPICSGFNSPELLLNDNVGEVITWQYSLDGTEGSWVTIPGTAGLSGYTSGALTQTTWFNAVVKNGVCPSVESASTIVTVNPLPQPPSSVSASSNIICPDGTTILSFTGGSGDVFNWYSGSCGGELVGSGNNLEQQLASTTTFFGRWENSCGTSTCQQIIVIAVDNLAPEPNLATLTVINAECEVAELTPPTATDNCSGTIIGTHTLTLPITSSTVIIWTYTDEAGNSSTQSQSVVINDVTPPLANLAVLPDLTDECEITNLVAPSATDNCSGTITGTHNITLPITSSTTITWTYTDAAGNSSTQLQNVVINDTTAPVANVEDLEDLVFNCSHLFVDFPSATDNCEGTIFAYTADPLYYDEPGSYLITWVYEDSSGNYAEQQQWLTIVNDEPVALTKDITIELNDNGTAAITNQDIDDGSYDDCEIENISIDMYEFNESHVGENIVTLTVTDNVGNTASETAIVTVIDPRISVKIPNFISPNNDGVNDFWEIGGVELLSGYDLIIFDKYGKVVYSTDEYDNSWNAKFNNQDLPDGTYFYHFSNGNSHFKGFISVVR